MSKKKDNDFTFEELKELFGFSDIPAKKNSSNKKSSNKTKKSSSTTEKNEKLKKLTHPIFEGLEYEN